MDPPSGAPIGSGHGPGPDRELRVVLADPSRFASGSRGKIKNLHRRVAYLTLRGWRSVRRVEGPEPRCGAAELGLRTVLYDGRATCP